MVEVPQTVVIAGVAGSGKSTVSHALAARTGAVVFDADDVVVVHLDVSLPVLRRRLEGRTGHFMPAALLDSQLEALQAPDPRRTVVVDADGPVAPFVDDILGRVGRS